MAALTIARAYQHSFDTHPNSTLAVTGGCLNALGDAVAQVVQNTWGREENEEYHRYDFVRPLMGRWNTFLESRFPIRSLQNKNKVNLKALWKRVACDQLVMAPIGLGLFLGSMGVMEARSPRQIGERFKDLYRTALLANWRVWPVAQLFNFRYTPLPYRVPFSQACGVFWTLYLSILNAEEDKRQDRELAIQKLIDSRTTP
ncbi:hypothetical protein BDZ97DRAFT_1914023 [Flammula alnicola]|nr:hypothetical protein BDZ97DRAFT_1914023 [Flammula alnicola]